MYSHDRIEGESSGFLTPVRESPFDGDETIVFNQTHNKQNIVKISDDPVEIADLLDAGWDIYPGRSMYILQAPEVVLCDLSEIHVNPTTDLANILTLYRLLNSVDLNSVLEDALKRTGFDDLHVKRINGDSLALEVRIAGSDTRVQELPGLVYEFLANTDDWSRLLAQVKEEVSNRQVNVRVLKDLGQGARKIYSQVSSVYKRLDVRDVPKPLAVTGFWKKLPNEYDYYLFILKSGLKYALGFIEDDGDPNKLLLHEKHMGLSPEKELRVIDADIRGKRVAILDRSYSSNTINWIYTHLLDCCHPERVALFPKSRYAIGNSDYCLLLDTFYQSSLIPVGGPNWQERLFIDVANGRDYRT